MEPAAEQQAPIPIDASLNYIAESSEKPVYYAYDPPPGVPRVSGRFVAQTMPIQNARAAQDEFSLDKQGFNFIGTTPQSWTFMIAKKCSVFIIPKWNGC